MTDIYGKQTVNGLQVTFRDAAGNLRDATIKHLHVPIYKADLEVTMPDGDTRFIEGALYNQGPAEGCWVHKPVEEQETPPANPSDDALQGTDPAAGATPKKGKK